MVTHKCLFLALIGCLLAGAFGQEDATFSHQGDEIRFLGKSAKFEIITGNSSMKVSFGAIQELDVHGAPVNGRKTVELASITPVFQQGYTLAADSTNVSYVRLHVPLSSTGLQYSPSECSSPVVTTANFQAGYMDIIYYFGFSNDTEWQYGYNNTLVAPGNSNKFSFKAANWPFCANGNTLQLNLLLNTGEGHNAKPMQSNFSDTDAELSGNNETDRRHRKLLSWETWQANTARGVGNGGGNGHSNGNGNGGGNGHGNSNNPHASVEDNGTSHQPGNSGHGSNGHGKRPQRDPRVAGHMTHQIALLMNSTAAATLDLETYAYDSENGTTVFNVTTSMGSLGDNTLVQLVFPTFTTIYYDPTIAVGVNAVDAGYTPSDLAISSSPAPAAPQKSAATPLRSGVMAALAGVLLMLVLM